VPSNKRVKLAARCQVRLPQRVVASLIFSVTASVLAFAHFDNIPAYILMAPGYLVQSWLFEHHRALGGLGYTLTMIGVSALVWTLIILGLGVAGRRLGTLVSRKRAA